MSKGMSNIQPKMQELQDKYKDDPKKLSEETMKLLKKEGSAPMKGCLAMLIQLPVFIGLYYVVRMFAEGTIPQEWLYSFFWSFGQGFAAGEGIDAHFLGMNLFENNNRILTLLVAVLNFAQFQLTTLTQQASRPAAMPGGLQMPDMKNMMMIMNMMMVVMMAGVVYTLASGVGLYLLVTSLFSIVQFAIQYRVLLKAKWDMLFNKNKPQVIEK